MVARRTAGDLRRLIAAVPYKVHAVLTNNGTHFTTSGNTSSAARTSRPSRKPESSFGRAPSNSPAPKTSSIIG